eukprot:2360722-Amphidinium_carterae.1
MTNLPQINHFVDPFSRHTSGWAQPRGAKPAARPQAASPEAPPQDATLQQEVQTSAQRLRQSVS